MEAHKRGQHESTDHPHEAGQNSSSELRKATSLSHPSYFPLRKAPNRRFAGLKRTSKDQATEAQLSGNKISGAGPVSPLKGDGKVIASK